MVSFTKENLNIAVINFISVFKNMFFLNICMCIYVIIKSLLLYRRLANRQCVAACLCATEGICVSFTSSFPVEWGCKAPQHQIRP